MKAIVATMTVRKSLLFKIKRHDGIVNTPGTLSNHGLAREQTWLGEAEEVRDKQDSMGQKECMVVGEAKDLEKKKLPEGIA